VLLLDDLQWADDATLQLLTILAAQLPSMRLLVVGTYRDIELDVARPFAKTLEALLRQRATTRITLRRLNEAAVTGMLASLGGSAPPSGLARAVFRETDGNPFFVEEVYRHLDEEARLFDAPGEWKADLRSGSIAVPEGVRLVVGRRLERLGEQARKVLAVAAVIGRSFALDVLNAAVDAASDDVLDALEAAERMQLIAVERGGRDVRYGFVHELIRATLIGGLSLPRRQRLHLRIADAIEKSAAAAERSTSMLAHHLYQAGAAADLKRTAASIAAALRDAINGAAFEEALELCDNLAALELSENDAHVAEALEHRGTALAGLDRHVEASAAWDRALSAYAARGDDAGVSRCARVAARTAGWLGRMTEAVALCRRGLASLSGASPGERLALELGLARAMITEGSIDEAQAPLARVLAAGEHTQNSDLLVLALGAKALGHAFSGEYAAAHEIGRRALAACRENQVWAQADEQIKLAQACWHLGKLDEIEELRRSGEILARRAFHFGALWNHEGLGCATGLARTGDFRAYLAIAEAAARGPRFAFTVKCHVALVRLHAGDAERGLAEITAVSASQPAQHWMTGLVDGCAFYAAALAGQNDDARAIASAVERWLPKERQRNTQGKFAALSTFVLGSALLGDRARCASVYPLTLLEIATGAHSTLSTMPLSHPQLSAALAAEANGLSDRALEHFEAALEQVHRVPLRPVQPVVLFFYGRHLAQRQQPADRERGRAMMVAALDDYRTLGMTLYAGHAESALAHADTAKLR
jgi:tetratricopeptide (TPR) repeat protein